jgi:hypothetical protein
MFDRVLQNLDEVQNSMTAYACAFDRSKIDMVKNAQCPLWVRSRHFAQSHGCPVYPRKQTPLKPAGMRSLCQSEHLAGLFDHLIGW